MLVGYMDSEDGVFCPDCWKVMAQAGKHPDRVLDSVNPNDPAPNDNFWVVDNCEGCGHEVKYKDVRLLE